MTNAINDGLNKPDQLADDAVVAAEIEDDAVTESKILDEAVTEDKLGALSVTEGKIGANAITYDKMAYGQITIGSPTAVGNILQTGSATLSAGSSVSVTFGTAFLAAPYVQLNYVNVAPSAGAVTGSNITTTGFAALGDTASEDIHWSAVGSGTY